MLALPALESVASQVSGTPTHIACDAPSTFTPGELGYVVFVDGVVVATIHLPRQTCWDLQHADTTASVDPAEFLTLTHEATHIALASTDECVVEKAAVANVWQTVRRFKLAASRVRMILAGVAAADGSLLPLYHEGC